MEKVVHEHPLIGIYTVYSTDPFSTVSRTISLGASLNVGYMWSHLIHAMFSRHAGTWGVAIFALATGVPVMAGFQAILAQAIRMPPSGKSLVYVAGLAEMAAEAGAKGKGRARSMRLVP